MWNYGAGLAAPVFEGGSLLNRRVAAKAQYQAAMADYGQTVLAAFEQVADTLPVLDQDGAAAKAQIRADVAAETALRLRRANWDSGLASNADLDIAEVQARKTHAERIAAEAARLQDCVALNAALGGGLWH